MKGNSAFYDGYNKVGSRNVKVVKKETTIEIRNNDHIKVPYEGDPNSVTIIRKNGKIFQERYYDKDGLPYLDIDYTDHGNPKQHPFVPHEHGWEITPTGERKRNKKGRRIK